MLIQPLSASDSSPAATEQSTSLGLTGTLLGGLLIGVASGVTAVFFPSASEAVMYVLMAIVLLMRPRGLLGEEWMLT